MSKIIISILIIAIIAVILGYIWRPQYKIKREFLPFDVSIFISYQSCLDFCEENPNHKFCLANIGNDKYGKPLSPCIQYYKPINQ